MIILLTALFLLGYVAISMEHIIKVNKAAVAIFICMLLWTLYSLTAESMVADLNPEWFNFFLEQNPEMKHQPFHTQAKNFVIDFQLIGHLGDVAEIVFFLLGAMTIVEMIDVHGGFSIITDRIKTKNKKKLLFILVMISFFMSAIIDNLTTAIIMITLLNKIISDRMERWWYGSIIIIAANGGGAWSPIGDVTTILLWVKGTVSPEKLMLYVFLPSLVSVLVPTLVASHSISGELKPALDAEDAEPVTHYQELALRRKLEILILGLAGLLLVPLFKAYTELPPFIGIMMTMSVVWIITDLMYRRIPDKLPFHLRIATVIKRIDMPTLIFFLGILLAVGALQACGGLAMFASYIDGHFRNVYVVNLLIGVISSIIDNVPLVAAALGLYPLESASSLAQAADPAFAANFLPDGIYWHFLTYCAGVGGSLLIIGSAAGVVVMGIEKIDFTWYLKHISLLALLGYLSGAAVFMLEMFVVNGKL